MRKRLLVGMVAGAFALTTVGGTVGAGEVTGGGPNGPKPTPIASWQNPNSICAFSGQNDDPNEVNPEDPFAGGRVQSFGDIVQEFVRKYSDTPGGHVPVLQENKPGIHCNKNRSSQ